MSIKDELILKYFLLCTDTKETEILKSDNPKDKKMQLAFEIVKIYHGEKEAKKAEENFIKAFQKKEIPETIKEIKTNAGESLGEVLVKNNILSSKSEWRRLISEGAVHDLIENKNIEDPSTKISGELTLKIGKKRFIKIIPK
jgi:tyrosyl-tRNA synthetase